MEQLALHEKIFIDKELLEEDENHSELSCSDCHKGDPQNSDWKTAHDGVIKDPSYQEDNVCLDCHDIDSARHKNSLHYHTRPLTDIVLQRAGNLPSNIKAVKGAAESHCGRCHSSCGQCHISRPESAEGGLLSAHEILKRPPMKEVCIACHGSRIGNEYLGKNESCKPDVHYKKAFMTCEKCHSAEEMHEGEADTKNRYEVGSGPGCLQCHEKIYAKGSDNSMTHSTHRDLITCQGCHSQSYTNCFDCHVKRTENGIKYYEVKEHSLGFKIGINPNRTEKRKEKYVTLRHVPVSKGTFSFYKGGDLAGFDSLPTWKMATPHNIRRKTFQNGECNNCHGNKDLFLLEKDVRDNEIKCNQKVVVKPEDIPLKIKGK